MQQMVFLWLLHFSSVNHFLFHFEEKKMNTISKGHLIKARKSLRCQRGCDEIVFSRDKPFKSV